MVLQTNATPVPLGPKGFVSRPRGDFQPGEYKNLSNVELLGEKLVGRRNMKMPNYNETGEYVQRNGMRHIGFWQDWSIYSDDLKVVAYSTSGEVSLVSDITDLLPYSYDTVTIGGVDFVGFHNVVGFFTYLGFNYLIVYSYMANTYDVVDNNNSSNTTTGYKLYRYTDKPSSPTPPLATSTDWHLINSSEEYNNQQPLGNKWVPGLGFDVQVASESDYMNSYFNNFFIFKDRLFICTHNGLYFSRPTDPTDFSLANGGGYFKTGELLTYAVGADDKIYVFSKNSTYVITFSEDPNVDAVITKISDTIGAITACIFRSDVYFINNEGLFTVNNNGVEKVMDTDFDDGLNVFPNQSLNTFGEYLILNKTYRDNRNDVPQTSDDYGIRTNWVIGSTFWEAGSGEDYDIGANIDFVSNQVWDSENPAKATAAKVEAFGLPPVGKTAAIEVTQVDTTNHPYVGVWSPNVATSALMNQVTAGKVYTYSAYIKAISGFTLTDGGYIGIDFYDEADIRKAIRYSLEPDTYIEGDGVQVISKTNPTVTALDTWYRFSITFKVIDPTITRVRQLAFCESIAVAGQVQFAGFMLEETNELKEFISTNLEGWVGMYYRTTTQYPGIDTYFTVFSNPAFNYWETVCPYFYRKGEDPNGNVSGFNTYFINMDTGSVHVLDYQALYSDERLGYDGFIEGIAVNNNYSDQVPNGDTVFFLNSDRYGAANSDLPNQYVSFMNYEVDSEVYDHVVHLNSDGTKIRKKADPRYLVEIDSFTPDGNEYLIKKFRNFEVMGKFPSERFHFSRAMDNREYNGLRDINDSDNTPVRLHLPHRIGINQRGRSISIKFATPVGLPLDENYDFFEVSDMRFLWLNTNMDTEVASNDSVSA